MGSGRKAGRGLGEAGWAACQVWGPKRGRSPPQATPPTTPLISHRSSLRGLLFKKKKKLQRRATLRGASGRNGLGVSPEGPPPQASVTRRREGGAHPESWDAPPFLGDMPPVASASRCAQPRAPGRRRKGRGVKAGGEQASAHTPLECKVSGPDGVGSMPNA